MTAFIQGIGAVGGFGCGVDALQNALRQGVVTPQQVTLEPPGAAAESFPAYLAATTELERFLSKRELRRIDHFSKMTLLGAHLALEDAALLETDRSRIGVVVASGYGPLKTTFNFLDSYLDFGYSCSSPTHFSNSVHNAAAAHVSMQLKLTSPSLTVTQFEMSVPSALLTSLQWLAEERVDHVLFGAVDEYCEVLRYCRQQFFGNGEQGPIQPLDFARQSAVVGEGAAFFVLSRGQGGKNYGRIDQVSFGNCQTGPVSLPETDRLIVGADGHRHCGGWYAPLVATHKLAAYTPLYGSFPTAMALDIAVAGLLLQDAQVGAQDGVTVPGLACLKFEAGGNFGLVQLTA